MNKRAGHDVRKAQTQKMTFPNSITQKCIGEEERRTGQAELCTRLQ